MTFPPPHLVVVAMGVVGLSLGVGLAFYSSVRGMRIWNFVAEHELAPDLTRSKRFYRFKFDAVCAVYEKATHDRRSVWITRLTGALAMILFMGSGFTLLNIDQMSGAGRVGTPPAAGPGGTVEAG